MSAAPPRNRAVCEQALRQSQEEILKLNRKLNREVRRLKRRARGW